MSKSSISIIGAGSYGTALAITLAKNNQYPIFLWGHNKMHLKQLEKNRCNQLCFPEIFFPDNLIVESDLSKIVDISPTLIIVVPSYAFSSILKKIKPLLKRESKILWATKGLEQGTGLLLHDVAKKILGNMIPLAIISGPTFAKELALGLPTAISLASFNENFAEYLQKKLYCGKNFRIYKNSDCIGVQVGGIVKNIIAIGAGISDSIGFGANARTALITRGLAEMSRLGIALGAKSNTFMGMAGLGDLVLSCTDDQSRNRRFGKLLGKGNSTYTAKKIIGQVIEGYQSTKEVWMLSQNLKIDMPITEQIYQILYSNKSVQEAVLNLLQRKQKEEDQY
ncbi:NAD(P)H-dependent glycerol-3-phosphate dehydrogenase [Candidatus Tachikawaea gelatinosa]|uniref:Glycerol-3-phosphate dehydrogenase [NAD(P)+] n=1 Tax=Candidatus Tachikawaea gelatinosa TaxID=1410383 RepID=A0A090AS79_9ENTR|nr:NAD(P)H-dependent glycerol-3-phosphate dehydrogenase [Candidatus Tachikawaea gelatinosa]BAP58725.1 glycerol-3-phosphate dehydrogenase [NAD(P)+] [Candidatus Tachikawaea gelatinosa]